MVENVEGFYVNVCNVYGYLDIGQVRYYNQ